MTDIFVKFVKFVSSTDFERERGCLVVVVVDEDVEDDGVQQVDPVGRVGRPVGQVGEVDMQVEVTGLVVKVTPHLAALQAVLAGHCSHRQLSDVPQQRQMVGPQVSQGLQSSLVDDSEAVQVSCEPS